MLFSYAFMTQRGELGAAEPRLRQYGNARFLWDVLCVGGFVEVDERGEAKDMVLNRGSTITRLLAGGLLAGQRVTV